MLSTNYGSYWGITSSMRAMEPDWEKIFAEVDWHEFEHNGSKYRAGQYVMDGKPSVACQKYVGEASPHPSGWIGYRLHSKNYPNELWPDDAVIGKVLKDGQPRKEPVAQATKPARPNYHRASKPLQSRF